MNQGLTDRDSIAAQITSIAQLKSQKNEMMKINTVRAREEQIKNKFQRPTQLIGAIDQVDYFRELALPKSQKGTEIGELRNKGVLMKNNETTQLKEPDARASRFIEQSDIISQALKSKGQFTSNNRSIVISHFYESNFGNKNQVEHKEGMEKFPNLFNKQKSEFLKFTNVNEPTQRIIKSSFFSNSHSTRSQIGNFNLPAAGRASGATPSPPPFKH